MPLITVDYTEAEYAKLQAACAAAGGTDLSTLLRAMVAAMPVVPPAAVAPVAAAKPAAVAPAAPAA
jgi:hypothetical protein